MTSNERILIAVDDSRASTKAVQYCARILRRTANCDVRLFHIVEPIGPLWICMHGTLSTKSSAPAGDARAHLIGEAKKRSRPVLGKMLRALTTAGLKQHRIESTWFVSAREDTLVFELLKLAREEQYGTVVVGRTALPWYRELFHHHLAEQLVRHGEGLSVWVAE
jgi:nucleotide-binding universal stress UspA family protein